jgi:SARP family transcriptional regulator, regulator of embCAB operon
LKPVKRSRDPALRIYVTGKMAIETGGTLFGQEAFPAVQGCLAFARLALDHGHAVGRDDLAEVLWPRKLPRAHEGALSAIISKLRALLVRAGFRKSELLTSQPGGYQLSLPPDAWIDFEAAGHALHEAETARRAKRWKQVFGPANVAYLIGRRPFFIGEEGAWLDERREKLRTIFVRGAECLADFYLASGEPTMAVEAAKDVVHREPFRETGCQLLMRAYSAAGNRADALLAYEKCRKLISEELGADPAPETQAIYRRVLRST